jgi:putative peptidoglycan lipid II flippase
MVLGVAFAFSALLGFFRTRILYDFFFASHILELDAFNAAFRLPDLIFKLLVAGALSASFIPVYSNYIHKDKKTADEIASTVINLLFIVFIIAALVIFIFARPLSNLIAQGFDPYQISIMVRLTRILLISQIFFLLSSFVTSILHVNQIFIIPALSPILYNITIILSIYLLSPTFGIAGVAWGCVFGSLIHFFIQIPTLKNQGFNYQLIIKRSLTGVKEIIRLMVPRTLSVGLGEIENTVTLFFTSILPAGSLSLLNLALQLMYLPSRIFSTTVGQASLPILSKKIAQNKHKAFKRIVIRTIFQSIFIALPIAVMILVLRLTLVRIVFGTKNFPWEATKLTANTLGFLVPAILCQAIIQIIIRAFYALHNTKTPLKISLVALVVNIFTSFMFIKFTNFGIMGLAISSSLSNIIQCVGLVVAFALIVKGFDWPLIYSKITKIFFASFLMGIVTWLSLNFFDRFIFNTTRVIDVMLVFSFSVILGIISYFCFSLFFKIDEINGYLRQFKKITHFISSK